ncbi:MAG: sporulation protein YqfD [Clostridia bacterium]|nr:sporulation protein YqfD [Clostridia bacterium]
MLNRLFSCTVKVQCTQKSRLLTALSNAKITVWDVKTESNYITFTLKIKDLAKTFAILKNMCYNYSVCERKDLKNSIKSLLGRIGLLVGALLATFVIVVCNYLIVGVRVKTEDNRVKDKIMSLGLIKESCLIFKSSIDLQQLKSEICSVEGVADCAVKMVGNFIEIDVITNPNEEERLSVYSSYVAKYDATVTSVVAHKGKPLIKSGDRVFAGTPLISPIACDENGEEIIYTGISGKVLGEVVLRKTLTVDKFRIEFVNTGNRSVFLSFSLKPQFVPSPYKLYNKKVTNNTFNLFFPVCYTKTEFIELEERVIETNVESFAKTALEDFIAECGQVGEEALYSYKDNGREQYEVSLYVKIITEIGIGV